MLLLMRPRNEHEPRGQRLDGSQYAALMMQQGERGMGYLREKWTEGEVLNLSTDEHDHIDRKSGRLLSESQNFNEKMAKALSAFANSGGGHLIFGMEDDATISGVEPQIGKTPTREWLEQKLPYFVEYPLQGFKVHQVVRATTASQIPGAKELYVIDVGDSRLAPHQAAFPKDNKQYYYRQAGKSIAAPHHYLEALRNRITSAVLVTDLDAIERVSAYEDGPSHPIIQVILRFKVTNTSRVACYRWAVVPSFEDPIAAADQFIVSDADLRRVGGVRQEGTTDLSILPTLHEYGHAFFGFRFFGGQVLEHFIHRRLLPLKVHHYAISENHIGESKTGTLSDVTNVSPFRQLIFEACKGAGIA